MSDGSSNYSSVPFHLRDVDLDAVSTGERLIDASCRNEGISLEGKRWLKLALDPFPDDTRVAGGFPDMISSKSIRVPYKLTRSIAKDPALGAGAWDLHITHLGLMNSCPLRSSGAFSTTVPYTFSGATQGATPYDIGGLTFRQALAGNAMSILDTRGNLFANLPTDRPWRVISQGFEATNMTEDLYKSGRVVCYRQPSVPTTPVGGGLAVAADTAVRPQMFEPITPPPLDLSTAQNLPDSTNWAAEEGAYVVCCFDGPTNEPNVQVGNIGARPAPLYTEGSTNYVPQILGASPVTYYCNTPANTSVPFNTCGMYFGDLSEETKIDLAWHFVVEIFPPPSDLIQSALATPSATYDPMAIEMYAKALRTMPVAVPVGENGLGTFFLNAAKSIASWAAPKLLKGLDDPESKEDRELEKIKAELQILREMQIQERSMRQPVVPRSIIVSPNERPRIVPSKPAVTKPIKPTPPPKPAQPAREATHLLSGSARRDPKAREKKGPTK